MRFIKFHGLGNDYLVLSSEGELSPARVRAICDRHRGAGADGILEPRPSAQATAGLRIWNPDGSEAEKSGNGLRIFARYLVDHRGVPLVHTVEVASGVVRCEVHADRGDVSVEMGVPTFEPLLVPCARPLLDSPFDVGGVELRLTAVGLGNPHCVVFVDHDLDALPWRDWGRALEVDPLFPNRTNVQFARVILSDLVEVRIWERGAGETLASGSSATAVVAAGQRLGRLGPAVTVRMPGGSLQVYRVEGGGLVQRGPVEEVGEFLLTRRAG